MILYFQPPPGIGESSKTVPALKAPPTYVVPYRLPAMSRINPVCGWLPSVRKLPKLWSTFSVTPHAVVDDTKSTVTITSQELTVQHFLFISHHPSAVVPN